MNIEKVKEALEKIHDGNYPTKRTWVNAWVNAFQEALAENEGEGDADRKFKSGDLVFNIKKNRMAIFQADNNEESCYVLEWVEGKYFAFDIWEYRDTCLIQSGVFTDYLQQMKNKLTGDH